MTFTSRVAVAMTFFCASLSALAQVDIMKLEQDRRRQQPIYRDPTPQQAPRQNPLDQFMGDWLGGSRQNRPPQTLPPASINRPLQNDALISSPTSAIGRTPWYLLKDSWDQQDEADFSRFVRLVGQAAEQGRCSTSFGCIRLVSKDFFPNPDAEGLAVRADCADWPHALRMYFAFKRGLPFMYTAHVSARIPEEEQKDPTKRYTSGNVVRRVMVLPGPAGVTDFATEYNRMVNSVSTATFRVHPVDQGATTSEFYSPAINRGSIRPGTAIYDANGHVGVVFDINSTGQVKVVDAHHKTMTVGTEKTIGAQASQWQPSAIGHGWGFKNFRPIRIVGVQSNGVHLLGGRVEVARNEDISDFSLEQYLGTKSTGDKREYIVGGKEYGFHDFVRVRMAGRLVVDPVPEFRDMVRGYCQAIRERANLVEEATKNQIWQKPHPGVLPDNIFKPAAVDFAAEWDDYSSPGRDIRLRTFNIELDAKARHWVNLVNQGSKDVLYRGNNLGAELLRTYQSIANSCTIQYTNSRGASVSVTMPQIMSRLAALSFDPYQCPERRWGATGNELASCATNPAKDKMHRAQQFLRDATTRVQSLGGVFNADQLLIQASRSGIQPQQYQLENTLRSLGGQR